MQSFIPRKHGALLALSLCLFARAAQAGGGHVNADGTVELNVNFSYPPTQAEVERMQLELQIASRSLCDASDGAIRLGHVTLTSGDSHQKDHDIEVNFLDPRSDSALIGLGEKGLGASGVVNLSSGEIYANTIEHELGHYLFGVGDEYNEDTRWQTNCGIGTGIDGTLSEVADASANTQGHTIMMASSRGSCGVRNPNVAGGIDYTGAGGTCNVDSSIDLSKLNILPSSTQVLTCPNPTTQVCFPQESSELTVAANHDRVNGLSDSPVCPNGVATTKITIGGTLNNAATNPAFDGTSFVTAKASSAFSSDFSVIDTATNKRTVTLFFVRRSAAGANKWTVKIGVPRTDLNGGVCPAGTTGELCILDSIDFTTAPAVNGCGDYIVGTGEQCDTGKPTGGLVIDTCTNKYVFNLGNITCNNACGIDTSQCLFPIALTCGLIPGVQAPEDCDGASLNGKNCQSLGFGPGGTLSCNPNCSFNTNSCNPLTTFVPAAVTLDGGRTLPINIQFPYAGAATPIQLTQLTPSADTTFNITTSPLTQTYGTDTGAGKSSCAKDVSLEFCFNGWSTSTNRFETSGHSQRYHKDCTGTWIFDEGCTTNADCLIDGSDSTCQSVAIACEDYSNGQLSSLPCNRCVRASPLPTPLPCPECSTNPKALCGVSEHEVLARTVKDLNATPMTPARNVIYANPPPTAADPISKNPGWDEPADPCFSPVAITNSTTVPDQVYIILDISGSMTDTVEPNSVETKIAYAKAALRNYVQLRQGDVIPLGFSFFDHEVNPVISTAPAMKQIPIATANAGTPSTATQILTTNDAMVSRQGTTAIGNALIAAVAAFQAAPPGASSRRIYIFTDGYNNTGPDVDDPTVKAALATLNIHVDMGPIGSQVDQTRLNTLVGLSGGSYMDAPQGDSIPDVLADFGLGEKSDSLALPQTESLVYNQSAWDAASCTRDKCISPLNHAALSLNEDFPITVEAGAQKLEALLVSRQQYAATWSPDFQLVSPNGSQVITPSTAANVTHDDGHVTCLESTACRYWSRINVNSPAAGTWHLKMATTQAYQASYVSARVRNPSLQCFVDLDKSFVPDGKPVAISLSARSARQPIDARTFAPTGSVIGPNGVAVPLTFKIDRNRPWRATAVFNGYVGRGTYAVNAQCNVPATAQLVPSDPRSPGNSSVAVPAFARTASTRFYYNGSTMAPPIVAGDCDYDLIPDAIEGTADTDGDGWPDNCDPDSDNDGLSDRIEGNVNSDGDANPDYKDADSDNDGIRDEGDNCRKAANPTQSDIDGDGAGDACDFDIDGDGRINSLDNCPTVPNADQADSNNNGIGNVCEGVSGCTPVITAANQSITRCLGDVAPTAVTASVICAGATIPLYGSVLSVNGVAITNGSTFAANQKPDLPVGTVVIRWVATGPGKITVTKNQTVTITQADTAAACCPAGSTVITTTDFPETLPYPAIQNYCVMSKGGNDLITGGLGPDVFSGGDGDDSILGISGFDTLTGGNGNDALTLSFGGIAYGGPGNDTLSSVFGPAVLNGGDGNDTIFGSPFNDDITPGAGADIVAAGLGNDIVRINAPCEAGTFEALDGGFGFDTLYTPVPLTTLQQLGVVVVNFERIIVTGTADSYKSACNLVPCTPAPCGPLPFCGNTLLSSCPGQLINCPCGPGNTCRSNGLPAAPGVIGVCGP